MNAISARPLAMFVAMPEKNMGADAPWRDAEQIRRRFLEPVRVDLEKRLGRSVLMKVETKSDKGASAHYEMYRSALEADIYIADLTGANANVYLELGVRWALRDHVTVLVCQDIEADLKFNVQPVKAIQYSQDPDKLEEAKSRLLEKITTALSSDSVDSFVRQLLPGLATTTRGELENFTARIAALEDEIRRLRASGGEELVKAALAEGTPQNLRRQYLEDAIKINPVNFAAHFELGWLKSREGDYGTAIRLLSEATRLDPESHEAWRALGIASGKADRLDEARRALEEAVRLRPDDSETWSNLGGYRRRAARRKGLGEFDTTLLRAARDAYVEANRITPSDSYSLGNVARISLILATEDPDFLSRAEMEFEKLFHVANFEVLNTERKDLWKLFDLADALAFRGEADDAERCLREAAALIPEQERSDRFGSYLEPLGDILASATLDNRRQTAFQHLADVAQSLRV